MTTTTQFDAATDGLVNESTAPPRPSHGVALEGIRWETYEMLCEDLAECPGIRLTYDNGSLHIMTPLLEHESYSILLGQVIRVLAAECGLPFRSFGSTTYKSK